GVDVQHALDEPGVSQRAEERRGVAAQSALARLRLVARGDQLEEQPIPAPPRVLVLSPLEERDRAPAAPPELGRERPRRARDEPREGLLVPADEAGRRPLRGLLPGARLRRLLRILDHVLRRLRRDPALLVEALAAGAARDLLELAHGEHARL